MPRSFQVVVDCVDPDRMAAFWAEALDYEVERPPGGYPSWLDFQLGKGFPKAEQVDFAAVHEPGGDGRLCFLAVSEEKRTKNRLHLDINATRPGDTLEQKTERVDALVARLRDLGAKAQRTGRERGQYFVTMTDIEGNEFCVH